MVSAVRVAGTLNAASWRLRGVSGRLTLGLVGLFLLTGLVAGGAIVQMRAMNASVDRLIGGSFEPVIAAEELVQRVQMLVALSPKLLGVRDAFELDNLQSQITDMFDVLDRKLARMTNPVLANLVDASPAVALSAIDTPGLSAAHVAEITARRRALRTAIDQLTELVRIRLRREGDMARARQSVDHLLNVGTAGEAGAPASKSERAVELAAILYKASLATDLAEVERGRHAAEAALSVGTPESLGFPVAAVRRLVAGEGSLFAIRQGQLDLTQKLRGTAGDTNLRANQLVYAVVNLSADLHRIAEIARQERSAKLIRVTFDMAAAFAVAALIDISLIAYLQINVLRRLVALRNSVSPGAAGGPVADDRADEIGDLARSLRHFLEEISTKEGELRLLAATDSLTGLANRREFMARGEAEFARSRRYPGNCCVLMMDIDHFKHVNDTFGHGVGDDVIRSVAETIVDVFRIVDVVGRIGGEEFAVLMPETPSSGALAAAERLRAAVQACQIVMTDGKSLYVTISIGVAHSRRDDETVSRLLGQADKALYDAKNGGRNRVCLAPALSDERPSPPAAYVGQS